MKRLWVTGLSGFVGQAIQGMLAEGWLGGEVELAVPPCPIELTDAGSLHAAASAVQADWVIHLAAQSFVPESFRDPRRTYEINFIGTLNLLQALKACGFSGRMLYVGSGDVYGRVEPEQLPITENLIPCPRNPYAVSKVAAEALCYQWTQTENIEIVMARPFNHIGPGQSPEFAIADFAKQVTEIKLGLREAGLHVGDIDVTRDFTDVRDIVHAYYLLLMKGRTGEVYNVSSGKEYSIREMLDRLLALAGVAATVSQDPARLRRAEQRRVRASYEKLHRDTGWRPHIPIEQSLNDILSYWERKLKNGD